MQSHVSQIVTAHNEPAVGDPKIEPNKMAGIAELPSEILCCIFLFCVAVPEVYMPPKPTPVDRTSILHVCRRWREVAINFPPLWSDIRNWLHPPAWFSYMAQLSKTSQISVSLIERDWPESNDLDETTSRLLSETHRLKSLELYFNARDLEARLRLLAPSAPNLESLVIARDWIQVPSDFLSGGCPKLRELRVVDCLMAWNAPIFTNLTSFELANTRVDYKTPTYTKPEDLISALTQMHVLTHLFIWCTLTGMRGTIFKSCTPLPRLRSVELDSRHLEDICGLLKHFTVPSSAAVKILCNFSESGVSQILKPVLPSFRSSPGDETYPSDHPLSNKVALRLAHSHRITEYTSALKLEVKPHSEKKAPASPTLEHASRADSVPDASLRLEINTHNAKDLPFDLLPPEIVQSLSISLIPFSTSSLAKEIGAFSSVEHLTISGNEASQLIDHLSQTSTVHEFSRLSGTQPPPRPTASYLPNLKSITLRCADFNQKACQNATYQPLCVESLADALRARLKLASFLPSIVLEDCSNLSKRKVQKLEDTGAKVVWDGVKRPTGRGWMDGSSCPPQRHFWLPYEEPTCPTCKFYKSETVVSDSDSD
ncbi:hypothetical protein BKA70DRAFT_406621 [Coprinopsis sp. MPI-PUGE-AT-0042]|nr:hypothetical protein BKA70DRAFT_406621 [Coprinopsis sp. MPI-PUGE-AT-0042]